jgi:tetratricopeptide (TPR) repeat protein
MKIKPVFIYIGAFIIVIAVLIITSTGGSSSSSSDISEQMPNDAVHKELTAPGGEAPSKGNVSSSFMKKMDSLKTIVESNPNDTATVKEYAQLLSMAHQPQKAIELYRTILNKDPKRIDILLDLTFAYYNKGDLNKAEEITNKVLSIDKDQPEANYNLGAIAAAHGNNEKARTIWQKLVDKYPGTEVAQIAKSSLQRLK